jgi:hypothetical protein
MDLPGIICDIATRIIVQKLFQPIALSLHRNLNPEPKPFRFLDLSVELRLQIYDYFSAEVIDPQRWGFTDDYMVLPPHLKILAHTCHQVRNEVRPVIARERRRMRIFKQNDWLEDWQRTMYETIYATRRRQTRCTVL